MAKKAITLKKVHKAVYPETYKNEVKDKAIEVAEVPALLVFPMSMHIGAPAKPIVEVGQHVNVGTVVGEAQGLVSANIHSSVSGTVISIEDRDYGTVVVVKNDYEYTEEAPLAEAGEKVTNEQIRSLIRQAGIAGMGGATFPTDVKMTPPEKAKIDTIILNGAECEPYSTSDHRQMVEYSDEIVKGLEIIDQLFDVDNIYIGIENDSMEAAEALEKAAANNSKINIKVVTSQYPQGSEKQLIEICTGRQVPAGGLPADVGCVVSNVGTIYNVYRAVRLGKPMTERVVTINGTPLENPRNLLIKIGTPIDDLIDQCGGFKEAPRKVINGGPMMGKAVKDGGIPIQKGTTHVSFMSAEEVDENERVECIRCAECLNVCPVSLQPILISNAYERGDIDAAEQLGAMDCIECGNCSYICPSKIPLLENIRKAKQAIKANKEVG